jgi:very-short-patch-repair endonuclease
MASRVAVARKLRRKQTDAAFEAHGILVLRFWNNDVLRNTSGVLESIVDTLRPISPHPNPLPNGEGESASAVGE